jgi:hypothetical protein
VIQTEDYALQVMRAGRHLTDAGHWLQSVRGAQIPSASPGDSLGAWVRIPVVL